MAKARRISVDAPDVEPEHPEYQNACRSAIEPSVSKLLQLAADAGWNQKRAALALMFIAASLASDGELSDVAPEDDAPHEIDAGAV